MNSIKLKEHIENHTRILPKKIKRWKWWSVQHCNFDKHRQIFIEAYHEVKIFRTRKKAEEFLEEHKKEMFKKISNMIPLQD